jgi:hypothetical protein
MPLFGGVRLPKNHKQQLIIVMVAKSSRHVAKPRKAKSLKNYSNLGRDAIPTQKAVRDVCRSEVYNLYN